jgi:ABC-type branched-subunit amino acid transport system substrate-binding protein
MRFLMALALSLQLGVSRAESPPLVLGQSLPLSGPAFPISNRVQAGAKAWVDRVNASGGIAGRRLELVSLDDGGDSQRRAANLRKLAREYHALAFVNCLGERACLQTASLARELNLPLIGPFSGAAALNQPQVFSLRPEDRREAEALVGQLRAIGVEQAVLLVDGDEPARERALATALQAAGIRTRHVALQGDPAATLRELTAASPQALVLNLGPESLELLTRQESAWRLAIPLTVAALSSPGLTQLTRLLRDRLIGFTSVVPNPEISQLPLVREFERDAEAYVGPEAISLEGLAAYVHLRVCAEALRRAGNRVDGPALAAALENLGALDLGGFGVRFSARQHRGSEHVEIGLRGRDGRLRR